MKIYGLLGILLLLTFTQPVSAQIENVYTGITKIQKLDNVVYNKPDADYKLDYWLRIWNEGDSVNLTPENLNVKEHSCLVYLDVNTTNDISDKRICIFSARSSELYFNGNRIESGVTIVEKQSIILRREISDINNFDPEYYPNGNITFTMKSGSEATQDIIGEYYDGSINVINKTYETIIDEIPENYGSITGKKKNYIHFYLVSMNPNSILVDNSISSTFDFNVTYEFLNKGDAFTHSYPTRPPFGVAWRMFIEGVPNGTQGGGGGADAYSHIYFAENVRLEDNSTIPIKIPGRITDEIPDGEIVLWFEMRQPDENTFMGHIYIEKGELIYEYDMLPPYWLDYPLVDWAYINSLARETGTNILSLKGMWFAILIISVNRRKILVK